MQHLSSARPRRLIRGGLFLLMVAASLSSARADRKFVENFFPWNAVLGRDGNFYGSTFDGGPGSARGTVYRISPQGGFRLMTRFKGERSLAGASAEGELSVGRDGAIYGATGTGGAFGCGAVYKMFPEGRSEAVFQLPLPHDYVSSVLAARTGKIYVARQHGPVIRISPDGSSTEIAWPYSTRYGLKLAETPAGEVLFADVQLGQYMQTPDTGTLYRLNASEQFEPLADVAGLVKQLLPLADGSVVVLTEHLQRVEPNGTVTVLHRFDVPFEGQKPLAVFVGADGSLVGHTAEGGLQREGVVFRLDLGTAEYTVLKHLAPADRRGAGGRWVEELLPLRAEAATAKNQPPATRDDVIDAATLRATTASAGLPACRIRIFENDRDAEGGTLDCLGVESTVPALHGTAVYEPGAPNGRDVIYTSDTPKPTYDSFEYIAVDGQGGSSRARVVIRPDRSGRYRGRLDAVAEPKPGFPAIQSGEMAVRVNHDGVFVGWIDYNEKGYVFSGRFNDYNLGGAQVIQRGRVGGPIGVQLWLKPRGAAWEVDARAVVDGVEFHAACPAIVASRS